MDALAGASGAAFDTMFLEMMIVHHEGAIADAQREMAEGANTQAKDLAAQIVSSQTAELDQMRQLLQTRRSHELTALFTRDPGASTTPDRRSISEAQVRPVPHADVLLAGIIAS
jgi:hypothetical protein